MTCITLIRRVEVTFKGNWRERVRHEGERDRERDKERDRERERKREREGEAVLISGRYLGD